MESDKKMVTQLAPDLGLTPQSLSNFNHQINIDPEFFFYCDPGELHIDIAYPNFCNVISYNWTLA